MKKILSFILVLAMVLGCVSMVTFASDGEDSATGFKVTISDKDQRKILYKNGLNVNNDTVTYAGNDSYYVFFKFRVYNLGDEIIYLYPRASVGWDYFINDAVYTCFKNGAISQISSYQTIAASSYMEFGIWVPVTNDNGTYKITGTHYQNSDQNSNNLNTIMIRWEFGSTNFNEGREFVFEALTPAAQLYCDQMASVYAFTVDKITTTDIYSVTNIPVLSGIKIKFNQNYSDTQSVYQATTAGKCDITKYEIFAEEDGKRYVERQFVVYNTTDHLVKFTLFYQATSKWANIDNITYPDNGTNTVELSPYSRVVYSCRIEVNDDDTVSWNKTNGDPSTGRCSLQDLIVRFSISNTSVDGYGMKTGDEIIIQPLSSGSSDVAYTLQSKSASNFSTEKMYGEDAFYNINGAAPVIGESLALNVSALVKYDYNDAQLRVTRNNGTSDHIVTIDGTINETGQFVFEYTGINAQCMGDNLTFELIVDGVTVATYDEGYSIKQYVINMFGKTADELGITDTKFAQLKILLSDMLVYGAEAQKYIDYRTDALVTENLVDAEENEIELTPSTFNSLNITTASNVGNNNTAIKSAGLNISYVNKIYFRLVDTVDMKNADISITAGGSRVKYTVEDNVIYTEAIMATGFDTEYTITVVSGGETSVINYSVNTYIAKKFDSTTVYGETTIGEICQALYNYGQSAVAYVEAE